MMSPRVIKVANLKSPALDLVKEKECKQVHLNSGCQRNDAHRLYLNKGFDLVSLHFR